MYTSVFSINDVLIAIVMLCRIVTSDCIHLSSNYSQHLRSTVDSTTRLLSEQSKVSDRDNHILQTNSRSLISKDEIAEYNTCKSLYGHRQYLSRDVVHHPPMLYSFQGSGNTWSRLLIEYATGVYTGSTYNDPALLPSLPGEYTCNNSVSVVKFHPNENSFESIIHPNYNDTYYSKVKCRKLTFDKAILIIRNPYDAIWSEYQRITVSHNEGVLIWKFSPEHWQAQVHKLLDDYVDMISVQFKAVEDTFKKDHYVYVRYEDMKNTSTNIISLKKMVDMIDFDYDITTDRLQCAFKLASDRNIHRSTDISVEMSKDFVYPKPLVCDMWKKIAPYVDRFGYQARGNVDCAVINTCSAQYGSRRFLNDNPNRTPPFMYAFPGPANTYTRQLVDYGSGVYTGSPFDDPLQHASFLGEGICDHTVSAVKLLPNSQTYERIIHTKDKPFLRCPHIVFHRAILFVRDPYETIWLAYVQAATDSILQGISRRSFDKKRWIENAIKLVYEYYTMWSQQYHAIQSNFAADDYIIIRYEDLLNTTTQVETLRDIIDFVDTGDDLSLDRIKCAFSLSSPERKIDPIIEVVKDDVFQNEAIVCAMWDIFGSYVKPYGYKPFKGYDCENRVNQCMITSASSVQTCLNKLHLVIYNNNNTLTF